MKKATFILMIILCSVACRTSETDFTKDIDSIVFYDFFEKEIALSDLKAEWNKRIQNDENIDAIITDTKVLVIADNQTKKEKLILLAYTSNKATKTATEVTRYKNGLKLSNLTVTCKDCSSTLKPELSNGDWVCPSDERAKKSCTKIVTLSTE